MGHRRTSGLGECRKVVNPGSGWVRLWSRERRELAANGEEQMVRIVLHAHKWHERYIKKLIHNERGDVSSDATRRGLTYPIVPT
jgi:hypothetical protein